jgi:hypothetical protein
MHILNMSSLNMSSGGQMVTGTYTLKRGVLTVTGLERKPKLGVAWPSTAMAPSGLFGMAYEDEAQPTGYKASRQQGGSGSTVTWVDTSGECTFVNGTFTMRVASSSSSATARYYLAG